MVTGDSDDDGDDDGNDDASGLPPEGLGEGEDTEGGVLQGWFDIPLMD